MTAKRRKGWAAALLAGLVIIVCLEGYAFINPNFTPIHLVRQSSLVLEVEFTSLQDGKAQAAVKRALKGKLAAKSVTFDLTTCAIKGQSELDLFGCKRFKRR